jgi:hypothetical protein
MGEVINDHTASISSIRTWSIRRCSPVQPPVRRENRSK